MSGGCGMRRRRSQVSRGLVVLPCYRVWTVVLWLSAAVSLKGTQAHSATINPQEEQEKKSDAADSEAPYAYDASSDFSWAVSSTNISHGQNAAVYEQFMNNCRQAAVATADKDMHGDAEFLCDAQDAVRLEMNQFQPRSTINYTATGYHKRRVPEDLRLLLQEFWEANRDAAEVEWGVVTPYHNSWEAPPKIARIGNRRLQGGGPPLEAAIANAVRPLVEEWTGMRQAVTSVYGLRIYYNNSILTPHVDRLPLVSSAIINIAQDVDEPWPLEVYNHAGQAVNVTMEPWDMVLYESHSVIHGRPFPFRGRFFANVFCHFEPIGPLVLQENKKVATPVPAGAVGISSTTSTSHNKNDDLPPYLIPNSPWEREWRQGNPDGWTLLKDASLLAQRGDLTTLQYAAYCYPDRLLEHDENGWGPIHDAARAGHYDILKFFIEDMHLDMNTPTLLYHLPTPLAVARSYLREGHAVVNYLEQLGASDEWLVEEEEDLQENEDDEIPVAPAAREETAPTSTTAAMRSKSDPTNAAPSAVRDQVEVEAASSSSSSLPSAANQMNAAASSATTTTSVHPKMHSEL